MDRPPTGPRRAVGHVPNARQVPRLLLPDGATLADLRRYVARARRVDADGAVRLIARQDVLAMYVAPLHGAGGPTVLGLRVLRLAGPCETDLTAPLAALAARLDRLADVAAEAVRPSEAVHEDVAGPASGGASQDVELVLELDLPQAGPAAAAWAGVTPPRQGWQRIGLIDVADLRAVVAQGVAEVVAGTPPAAGAPQVAALRGRVWGRPLLEQVPAAPSGLAFAADALAFLDDAEPAALFRAGPWFRLSTVGGHVVGRPPLPGL